MFNPEVYSNRRKKLGQLLNSGLILLPGNSETAFNYNANTYNFRQDSSFLYFFGLDHPGFAGIIDVDNGKDYFFGDEITMDDIIWMGPQPSLSDRAAKAGISNILPYKKLGEMIQEAIEKNRKIHFLPTYRGEQTAQLAELLGKMAVEIKDLASVELIKSVIRLRSVKDEGEVKEIEFAMDIAYNMHTTAMKMAMPGVVEREIAGKIEGIALSEGLGVSFPIILSINGQILHNHYHGNILVKERMMVTDAGAESVLHYASDITRTVPVGGKFSRRQKEIYEIVLAANMKAIESIKPGITNKELHIMACQKIASGLKDLGLMKGDVDEAVNHGAHALFMPHGLGHMMGLDVHDMEGLGENWVGYDDKVKRSDQFGLAFLRFGKQLEPGFVFTIEPGLYFIPALIDKWKGEHKFVEFINYDRVESYKDFGGIRIEDDILVTNNGYKVLGKPIPKTIKEVEDIMV
ncbi:MAG: aminopeptidase P family protein [Bacteroidetes bacterium]|nr:aminopeptidase P family protein [Bacteroidota bacterium]